MFKFIGAALGFFLLGRNWLGAFLGFIVGSYIDSMSFQDSKGKSADDMFDYYKQRASSQRGDFATMLIALSASVVKADGKISTAELDYIKSFFSQQFGPQFSGVHAQTLKQFTDATHLPLEQICADIKLRTQLEVRIQLTHYLFGIAKADGHVAESELKIIKRIAELLGIPQSDFESLKNMFYRDTYSDYKVLGIESTATEEEIKKAYRQMAVRYHPDKVAQMGEEYQKGAKEKFQKVQEAYENIKKQRGIN